MQIFDFVFLTMLLVKKKKQNFDLLLMRVNTCNLSWKIIEWESPTGTTKHQQRIKVVLLELSLALEFFRLLKDF